MAEFNISTIFVVDWYGGPHQITREDYFKNNPNGSGIKNVEFEADRREDSDEVEDAFLGMNVNVILKD